MPKWLKIILGVIGVVIIFLVVDLICIFTIDRPLFAIKKDNGTTYKGLLYDTYNCPEYSTPQIKAKGTKFACAEDKKDTKKVLKLVDKTQERDGFTCAQALEKFYEDDNYTYYWNCIKNKFMVVIYENGDEDLISDALKNKTITISDLDRFEIKYYKEENTEENSFFGKVVESYTSYIIVEPNEVEEERKSSDKFHIALGEDNDAIYEVGTNVKITYTGKIKESYPAQIDTTKIEIKSVDSFELIFNPEPGDVKRQIIDKNTDTPYNYDVYVYNGNVEIIIDNTTYTLENALKEKKITMEEIIAKANQDIKDPLMYKDGGSIEYHYPNYTIIKFHTLDGNRDVYIGNKDLTLSDI